ncbi:MAG: primosomal protein N' [Phycisphaeraceae bacterium]|nr:MAG: primosomal protein N' [Phycisphaeraceae bacterium]
MERTIPMFAGDAPPNAARFVRVVVERGIDTRGGLDGLTYASRWDDIAVGERVNVPLGTGDTSAGGVVVAVGGDDLLAGLSASKIKHVSSRAGAGFSPPLIELARWVSAYTVTPLGVVLAAMMPAAVKKGVGRRGEQRLSPAPADVIEPKAASLSPALASAWARITALEPDAFPVAPAELAQRVGEPNTRSIRRLTTLGLLTPSTVSVVRVQGHQPTQGDAQGDPRRSLAPEPSPEQSAAIAGISADPDRFAVHLLRGVTGSGKTEVYIRLLERVLARGRGAIVLVPEIALTPQTETWFRSRLGPLGVGVAVLHSGLSASQRHAEWERAAKGHAKVVIGPRSAVFAPVSPLGLIVVDEEHEGSYKHEQLPRYHARDVAIKRGQLERCPVVLGSATPSMESWANASGASPKFRCWHLPRRVGGGSLPAVTVVDMAAERRVLAASGIDPSARNIGPTLERELARTLADGGQAILLLNRRGYASMIACARPACGWVLRCDACDAAMVLHRGAALPKGALVRCHHCLAEQLVPPLCPSCQGAVGHLGAGTQRVEEELLALLGASHGLAEGSTMVRVDSDTMSNAGDYFRTLARFGRGEARVLLGTQMIAKGLDFPGVRLVGVVSADTGLNMPDFRAGERTFQLISQVAGRAGRGELPGRVIVQTYAPDSPPILHAAAHDYLAFAAEELELRRAADLPPARRMARIVCREQDAAQARSRAVELASRLRAIDGLDVQGPMEAPISRIAGYYRWAVEVYATGAGAIQRGLTSLRAAGLLKSDSRTAVDVDPISLL